MIYLEIAATVAAASGVGSLVYLARVSRDVKSKINATAESVTSHSDRVFTQTEALLSVYRELDGQWSLPFTRDWAASPDMLLHVVRFVLATKPDAVIECGSGVSTQAIARALKLNGRGHVFSLDHDAHYSAETRERLSAAGLSDWATVFHAPLVKHDLAGRSWNWYDLQDFPPVRAQVLLVDGPPGMDAPQARYPALPLLRSRLADRSTIFVDDADRPHERAIVARWKEEHPTMEVSQLRAEKGLTVCAL
jgi:hypothetical protein